MGELPALGRIKWKARSDFGKLVSCIPLYSITLFSQ